MEKLELLPRTFNRPNQRWSLVRQKNEPGNLTVRVLFDSEIARWVREARSYYMVYHEETPEGLLVTLKVRHESEILSWLLSWGRHVHVREPDSLRALLAEEAQAMLFNFRPN